MIQQYDLEGNLIAEYESLKLAAFESGCSRSGISNCTSKRYKQHKGYVWEKVIPKKVEKPKAKPLDPDRQFVEGEICAFRLVAYGRTAIRHEVICFSKTVAEKLTKAINKRFAKYDWSADWYYKILDDIYIVECRRN